MTVSVVIPTLNEERTINATLARLGQPALTEVIVVDGGSQDRTVDMAKPKARIVTAPRGRARQMNAGAAVATGDVLLFLHADTLLPLTAGEDMLTALRDPAVVGGRFDVRFDPHRGLLRVVSRMMNWRSRMSGIATGDQAMFIRRTVFDAVEGFPDLPIMEDVAFSASIKRIGRMAALRSTVVTSGRRWQQGGIVPTILLMWWLRMLYSLGASPERMARLYANIR